MIKVCFVGFYQDFKKKKVQGDVTILIKTFTLSI